ncbi:MAG TPA: M48 family metallopeptidase, partial [Thermoanaerobaculia bacterium]|nr:M48 family metallopeptidase [Thermoanaerobaculia bacterium]
MAHKSLATRAAIALALMIGFYALALGIAGGLLWMVYLDVTEWGAHARLILFGGGIAVMILWSIFPRPNRYVPDGVPLTSAEQPELFEILDGVASEVGQEMPAEVYLTREVNAGVLQAGGVMGFGSRRVMEVGLPLMQALTKSEFRAVIAHEFGHYHGGDTRLGPIIYRTHDAIQRTVETLSDDDSFIDKPFLWYGRFFLRVTQSIRRAQELAADRLSARVAGAKNAGNALIAVERASFAFDPYWSGEVMPLLLSGYYPPLVDGFDRFARVPDIDAQVNAAVEENLREPRRSEFDSHPPLRERLDALAELPAGECHENEPRAVSLLRDLPKLEAALLRGLFVESFAEKIQPVTWESAGVSVYLPGWRDRAAKHARVLREVTPAKLPVIANTLVDFSSRLTLEEDDGEHTAAASTIVGCALAVRLHDLGWMCESLPGKPIAFVRDGKTIEPFNVVPRLRKGELPPAEWDEACRA